MRRPHPMRQRRPVSRRTTAARRVAAAVAALTLVAAGTAHATAQRHTSTTARSDTGTTPDSTPASQRSVVPGTDTAVTLDSLTTVTPDQADSPYLTGSSLASTVTVDITGTVVNTGSRTWRSIHPTVTAGPPLATRSALAAAPDNGTIPVDTDVAGTIAELDPGKTQSWHVSFRASALAAAFAGHHGGVLPLTITLRGTADGSAATAGTLHTVLPWQVGGTGAATVNLALLWPVIDQPRMDGTTTTAGPGGSPTRELTDDDLATSFSDGRLNRLVTYGGQLSSDNITWVLDPDLLDTAVTMAGGYVVPTADGGTQPGSGTGAASTWLAQLRTAVGSGELDVVPSGDPDLTATVRQTARPQISDALTASGKSALTTTVQDLGRTPTSLLVWPVDGVTDRASAATAVQILGNAIATTPASATATPSGASPSPGAPDTATTSPDPATSGTPAPAAAATTATSPVLLLSSPSMTPSADLTYTPTGRTEVAATPTAVSDAQLDALLADDVDGGPGAGVVDRQLLLADTAMIAAEQPNRTRTVVLAPPRRWDLQPEEFNGLTSLLGAPWVKTVPLNTVTTLPKASWGDWTGPTYPAGAAQRELGADYVAKVAEFSKDLSVFTGVLTVPQSVTDSFGPAVYRSLSSAWRAPPTSPGGGTDPAFLTAAESGLSDLRSNVTISGLTSHTTITLAGNSGTLPITIENNLRQAVRVRVVLTSTRTNRLKVTDPGVITADASRQTVVRIPAKATANGPVQVQVTLLTPDGQALAPPQKFWVNVTHIGLIALVVFAVVGGLLAAAIVLRLVRRRRRDGGTGSPPSPDTSAPTPSAAG